MARLPNVANSIHNFVNKYLWKEARELKMLAYFILNDILCEKN